MANLLTLAVFLGVVFPPSQQEPGSMLQLLLRETRNDADRFAVELDSAREGASKVTFVDVASFSSAASEQGFGDFTLADVRSALGERALVATEEAAIERLAPDGRGRRRVQLRQNGVFIRLEGLERAEDGFRATVTYGLTHRRRGGSAVCMRQLVFNLAAREAGWVIKSMWVRRTC